jgi:hypothetical protein
MLVPDAERRLGAVGRLFRPGERLGWIFRDRRQFWRAFGEPPPRPVVADPRLQEDLERLAVRFRAARLQALVLIGVFLVSLPLVGRPLPVEVALALGLVAIVYALVRPGFLAVRLIRLRRRLDRDRAEAGRRTAEAMSAWQAREEEHRRREWERVDRIAEWGAARLGPEVSRIDVIGGSLWSWEAFLTTFGTSLVAGSPPLAVVDLSREVVCGELADLAAAAGSLVRRQVLPEDAARSDLLDGLDAAALAEALVEAVHGAEGETAAGRAVDARILGALCEALGPDLTPPRLEEALRALMGEPSGRRLLTDEEWRQVTGDLFSREYVAQARERLGRLEAHLHALRDLGSAPDPRPSDAQLTCLAVREAGATSAGDLLAGLAGQWALRAVSRGGPEAPQALVVAGADRLERRLLERLSDACERRQVRLVYLFQHLREQAFEVSGSRATVFMRLGQPEEAARAADLIGRGHRFVLDQITRSQGGREGSSSSESEGGAQGERRATLRVEWSRTRSRSWGSSESYATGSNWHYAETSRRAYEYRVEPRTLMDIPEYGMVIVCSSPGGPQVLAADCDPDRVLLPRVTTDPLPEADAEAASPTSASEAEGALHGS